MGGRPRRKRHIAERVRTVDSSALVAARARRLESLELDADDSLNAEKDVSDDDYVFSDSEIESSKTISSSRKRSRRLPGRSSRASRSEKKTAGIEKWNKTLQDALAEDTLSGTLVPEESYEAIAAKPSNRPARHLCSICGFFAAYTCTRCAVRFCSVKCGTVHEETRCLKFTL